MVKKKEFEPTKLDESAFQKIADRNSVSIENVAKVYDVEFAKLENETVNRQRIALLATMNFYRKEKLKKLPRTGRFVAKETTVIYGFIIGDSGIFDRAEAIRKHANSFIEKNGLLAAKEQGLVDGDNHILDTRLKVYGKENKEYGKSLSEKLHIKSRTLYGFFRHNGDNTFKKGSIQTNDNRLAEGWSKVRFFTPCQVPAVIDEEDNDSITMRSSLAKETMSIFKKINEEIDCGQVVIDWVTKYGKLISEVKYYHECVKDSWDRYVAVKGIVAWISDRANAFGSTYAGIMSPDNEDEIVRIEIPVQLIVDFGELSEIIVFGKTEYTKEKAEDGTYQTTKDVMIRAWAVMPIMPVAKVEEEDIKEPIEGWIDG